MNHEQEGEKHLKEFINGRIEGNISIWKPLKKTKLPTVHVNVKSFKKILIVKQIDLKKKERLIVSDKSRPEIDISKYFGDYEFPVVTKSLFHGEGKLIPKKEKYIIWKELENLFVSRNKLYNINWREWKYYHIWCHGSR